MTIPYLPGWWDTVSKNATEFTDKLQHAVAPNFYAGKKYEEMIQQDPSLLMKLADLDPVQRDAFARALGYKDMGQNPIAGMAEGPNLEMRRRKKEYESSLTPEQLDEYQATMFGGKSKRAIASENKKDSQGDILFGQTTKSNDLNLQIKKLEAAESDYTKRAMDSLRIKFPVENIDFNTVVNDMIAGKNDTPLIQRIMQDPTTGPTFKLLFDAKMDRIKIQAQKDIASIKSPQEKYMGIQFLQQNVDNKLQALNTAENELKAFSLGKSTIDPTGYKLAQNKVVAAKQEWDAASKAFGSAMSSEFGKKYQEAFKQINPAASAGGNIGPTMNSSVQKTIQALQEKKITLDDVRKSTRLSEEEKQQVMNALKGG